MHIPILHKDVQRILAPRPGETALDCTLGLGGHAEAFLDAVSPDGRLIGMDADLENLEVARRHLESYGNRVELHHCNFREVAKIPGMPVNIVFADLGLSSPHVDAPERGFSFRSSGPLDLRYDRSSGQSAAKLLVSSSEEEIAEILREFGELQRSRMLARELVTHFGSEQRSLPEWKTNDVVRCVEKVFGFRTPRVLPQVFQALRIAVNDELGALRSLLDALPDILAPGGRCGIISYHSLEDRLVKDAFRAISTPGKDARTGQDIGSAEWTLLTRKPVVPSPQETAENPRSRSAKFRAIRRTAD